MPTQSADSQFALDFRLSGAEVRVTGEAVAVRRKARTRCTDAAEVTASLSDAAGAASLELPGTWLPGRVSFGDVLPEVRVTPGTVAAARALMAFLGSPSAEAAGDLVSSGTPGVVPADPESDGAALVAPIDFVAFDVETANADEGSVIQLGAAVVRGGRVEESFSWPCRPPKGLEDFDEDNIAVHGIQPSDVAGAPSFAERLAEFTALVGDHPVVAHNAKFDFTALDRACRADGIDAPEIRFACTYRWARAAAAPAANYRLPSLAEAAGVEDFDHHDAAADARACAGVALWLMRDHSPGDSTTDPAAYSEALGLEMGHLSPRGLTQVRTVNGAAANIDAGNRGRARRQAKWEAAKTPDVIPEKNEDADPDGLLYGQRVTLTGDFAPYDKGRLWELIADAGADINKGVTRKTTILVAGPWDSVTSKEKRARELQEEGQEIEIWSEKQLFTVLGLDEEPPF